MPVRTAVFKIHNPSRHKRSVMDYAFRQYTLAFDYLLRYAKANSDQLRSSAFYKDKISDTAIARFLGSARERLQHFPMHGSLRDSLIADVAGTLASHLELKAEEDKKEHEKNSRKKVSHSFPEARRIKHREELYKECLEEFCLLADDWARENELRNRMARILREELMPLSFCRPDGIVNNRNFGLLYDKDNDKWFAALYLLHNDSKRKKLLSGTRTLKAVHPKGKLLQSSKRPLAAIIVPLSFGRWHEESFLHYALQRPESVRSAILTKKDGEYYLYISFDFDVKRLEQLNIMGIDRGIRNLVAVTVLSPDGTVLYQQAISGEAIDGYREMETWRRAREQKKGRVFFGSKERRVTEQVLHRLANEIVSLAVKYRAQVVVEDLKYLSRGGFKKKFTSKWFQKKMNRRLSRLTYNKLKTILEYKLEMAGLNKPKKVEARYTSQECPLCGCIDKANRPDGGPVFTCVKCGYSADADINGSHNVARRWIWVLERAAEKRREKG